MLAPRAAIIQQLYQAWVLFVELVRAPPDPLHLGATPESEGGIMGSQQNAHAKELMREEGSSLARRVEVFRRADRPQVAHDTCNCSTAKVMRHSG